MYRLKELRRFEKMERPVCDCGNKNASWHGDRCGRRIYCCDKCWKKVEITERKTGVSREGGE